MRHEEALQAARVNQLDSAEYVEAVVRAYLEARADCDCGGLGWFTNGGPHRADCADVPGKMSKARSLLADFGDTTA